LKDETKPITDILLEQKLLDTTLFPQYYLDLPEDLKKKIKSTKTARAVVETVVVGAVIAGGTYLVVDSIVKAAKKDQCILM
jgi:hypothetical protein